MLASLGIKKKLRIQLEVAPVEEEEAGFVRPDATVSLLGFLQPPQAERARHHDSTHRYCSFR